MSKPIKLLYTVIVDLYLYNEKQTNILYIRNLYLLSDWDMNNKQYRSSGKLYIKNYAFNNKICFMDFPRNTTVVIAATR